MSRAIAVLAAAVAAAALVPALAGAGAAFQPAAGSSQASAVALVGPRGGGIVRGNPVFSMDLPADAQVEVIVSGEPEWDGTGAPVGLIGTCQVVTTTAGRYTCAPGAMPLDPGSDVYWWVTVSSAAGDWLYGPERFRTPPAAPVKPTPVEPASTPKPVTPKPVTPKPVPEPAVSHRSYVTANALRRAARFTGGSVKHAMLTDVVYEVMKNAWKPRQLAVACWSAEDWPAVSASAKVSTQDASSRTLAFWLPRQPRWLHLSPAACKRIQELVDTGRVTDRRASGLAIVLHEALHAYGISNEAMTNCLAVQLVPDAGVALGMSMGKAVYLGHVATRATRERAPKGYWNGGKCREGGAWDMYEDEANLS